MHISPKALTLADLAVWALIAEAELTPKPALVDRRGSGAHQDLSLPLMRRSARALHGTFAAIAACSSGCSPDQDLRERLGAIGRRGETCMLQATQGSNSHRGAIWTLGLLTAGAMMSRDPSPRKISTLAARIARFPDRFLPGVPSHGSSVCARYGVSGARGEASSGFPHVLLIGLPALRAGRMHPSENSARLNALLAIMVSLDDTCLLHRGGPRALSAAQHGARRALAAGGAMTAAGMNALEALDDGLMKLNASPGGAADLLAATLFLDRISSCRLETATTS